jgi:hypothetical protein
MAPPSNHVTHVRRASVLIVTAVLAVFVRTK